MPKHGKKYQEAAKLVEPRRPYPADDAARLLKETSFAAQREPVFHYAISGHGYASPTETSSGISRGIEGSDLLVATGRAEAMVDDIVSPWDAAAFAPILEEAGGVLTAGDRDHQLALILLEDRPLRQPLEPHRFRELELDRRQAGLAAL